MRDLYSKLVATALLFAVSFSASAQSSEAQTFYFSKDLIKIVLSERGCEGLRMYPVIDEGRSTNSVIIVAIDERGNELSSKYQIFTGVRENNPTYSSLKKSDAQKACEAYFSKNKQFVSQVSKALIESIVSGNSLGIAIQLDANQKGNFMVSGYVNPGGLKTTGDAKPGDPCPNACGEPRQYLVFPKSTH
ncbi:hypothetical protein [Owenweeksia hongkongensis]|uniref:hypothetical protein n=1 Tax=Owenweeksia hongkongensis TaxID=253245 RepID=UPI003A8E7E1F